MDAHDFLPNGISPQITKKALMNKITPEERAESFFRASQHSSLLHSWHDNGKCYVCNNLIEEFRSIYFECAEIAKKWKCKLGRSAHEDQQDMTATCIMREILSVGRIDNDN